MHKGKHLETKQEIKLFSLLIFIAILFINIAYAEIISIETYIEGEVSASMQDGVFITNIIYALDTNADIENSKINYFTETMMESYVILKGEDSSITYAVTIYNNTDREQIFIGVMTDKTDTLQYSNPNIEYSVASIGDLVGLEEYITTIKQGETLTFPITFNCTETEENELICKLNFRFKEVPTIELDNEGETYSLENFYPGITPYEQTFTVTNYNETKINSVPMTYTFETTIDGPLTAKIQDINGKEITEAVLRRKRRK